jgi:hypothetical protein
MTGVQQVTLSLPEPLFLQIQRAAEKTKRSLQDILVEAASAIAAETEAIPKTMRTTFAQMAYLNDAALWQAARATMASAQRDRLAELHDLQDQRGLTEEEKAEEQALLTLYRETILVRAQAAVLLKQRGYNISDPSQFTLLE